MGLGETLEACAREFDWEKRSGLTGYVDAEKTRRRGIGLGLGWYRTSIGTAGDGCGANVHVHEDGSALLFTGITEMGQGSSTVLPRSAPRNSASA